MKSLTRKVLISVSCNDYLSPYSFCQRHTTNKYVMNMVMGVVRFMSDYQYTNIPYPFIWSRDAAEIHKERNVFEVRT